jgi:outer membrane receptor protein involved in Fe transport
MKQARRNGRRLAILALLALTILAVPQAATAQRTTSTLSGTVKSTAPVPGARVEAVAADVGYRQSAITDDEGRFSLSGLPPGLYELRVSAEAYQPQTREVQVLVAQDLEIQFTLEPGETFGEAVQVTAQAAPVVESRSSEIATNITPQQIQSLPQNNRNFLGFAALAPGVRFTENDNEAGQKFRSGGQDSRQVNVFIDGQSFKNDLLQGGAFMQDSSRGNPFPQNAVQEFRVLTQNYKAEYEKASAAVITAVTKSGTNSLKGDAFYYRQDEGLVTQDDFSKERGDDKAKVGRDQYGFSVGGPIVRDKLHFFVSYEGNDQDRNATVFRGPSFAQAPPEVQQFLGQYETGVLTQPHESDLFFGKISWQPAPSQNAFLSYHRRDEQEIRGFGGQRTRDGAESFEISTDALVAKHNWVLGNFFNEAAVNYQALQWNPTALDTSTPHLNYQGILDVGGKDSTQNFEQDKIGLRDDLTYLTTWHGDHTLKTGLSINWLDYTVSKRLQENPTFDFRSDENWRFPFQARIGFGDPTLEFSNTQYGIYLQDDWAILPNLTLNLGLRWDYESNMINNDYVTPPEVVDALANACRSYGEPVGGQTDWCLSEFTDLSRFTTDGNDRDPYYGMIQPRLGFAWSPVADGSTVIFGGWGKYYDRVILNDIFDEQYRQSWKIYSFCFSADGSPAPNCGAPTLQWQDSYLSASALRQLIASGVAPGPEIFLVDNELRPPRSDQWTLGVRQALGNWQGSLSYVNVRGYNGLIYFFADLPPGTDFDDRFGGNVPIAGYGRAFYTSTARRSWYDGVFLTLDRPIVADGHWGFHFAYTYSEAEQTGTDNPGEGVAFGAFDYASPDDLYRFPGTNDERHRVVMSGVVQLPWNFQVSSLITLGSGLPYTIFDDSRAPFTVRWNEGRPEKHDFIIPNAWAYRSVDLRVEWTAPPVGDVALTLVGEAFNVFDYDNYNGFNNFVPRLPAVNEDFGEPTSEFNTRRYQLGARVSF